MTGVDAALHLADTAAARYLAGRWDEALAILERAQLQPAGGAGEIALSIRAAQLLVGRGEFEKAARQNEVLARLLEAAIDTQWIAPATEAQAELAIWQGDPAAALRAVAAGLGRVQTMRGANVSRIGPLLALGMRAAADLAERSHRDPSALESARGQAAEHLAAIRSMHAEIATRWPAHVRLAKPYLALCEAEASRLAGKSDPKAWAAAAEQLLGLSLAYGGAYARYRLGEALLAARRDAAGSRAALRNANETACRLGASPLQEAIQKVAARGRVDLDEDAEDRARTAAPGGLTHREQEILGLVAQGMTNRQIGERLFITEKTASHHVSNILTKLGVSGRAEAAVASIRLGITRPSD
jgi:DNA-binding NarL/FixJ family response regulator